MKNHSLAALVFLVAFLSAAFAEDQIKPMGIALEEVEYPHPVYFLARMVKNRAGTQEMANMAYMAINQSNRPTVVLLHGKNFFGAYWAGTIKVLVEGGFRVIVPDQLGFGKSAKPDMDYSFDQMVDHTMAVLRVYGIEKFAVVGHSMGGMLAAHFAFKHPEQVTHLILENPIGLEDYSQAIPPEKYSPNNGFLFNKELQDTDPARIREFFKKYVVEWKPEIYEPLVEPRVRVTKSAEYPRWAKASAETYRVILAEPVVSEFSKITVKTLPVFGQKDRTVVGKDLMSKEAAEHFGNYPELGKKTARAIAGAKLVELPGRGAHPSSGSSRSFPSRTAGIPEIHTMMA